MSKRLLLLLALSLAACAPAPTAPPTPTIEIAPDKSTLLDWQEGAAVYVYRHQAANLDAARLCLWTAGEGYRVLAETGEDIRWFLNAVLLEDGRVVFVPYLWEAHLGEVWLAGEGGNTPLVTYDQFFALGIGFERAIPRKLALVPGHPLLLFDTFELGYQAEDLKDLHLLDLDTGELTTLIQPGQGGKLVFSQDGAQIAVQTEEGLLVFDPESRNLQPAPADFAPRERPPLQPSGAPQPWHQDCLP